MILVVARRRGGDTGRQNKGMLEFVNELAEFEVQTVVQEFGFTALNGNVSATLRQKVEVRGDNIGLWEPKETKIIFKVSVPADAAFIRFRNYWNQHREKLEPELIPTLHKVTGLPQGERHIINEAWEKIQTSHIIVKSPKKIRGQIIVTLYTSPRYVGRDDLRRYSEKVRDKMYNLIYHAKK